MWPEQTGCCKTVQNAIHISRAGRGGLQAPLRSGPGRSLRLEPQGALAGGQNALQACAEAMNPTTGRLQSDSCREWPSTAWSWVSKAHPAKSATLQRPRNTPRTGTPAPPLPQHPCEHPAPPPSSAPPSMCCPTTYARQAPEQPRQVTPADVEQASLSCGAGKATSPPAPRQAPRLRDLGPGRRGAAGGGGTSAQRPAPPLPRPPPYRRPTSCGDRAWWRLRPTPPLLPAPPTQVHMALERCIARGMGKLESVQLLARLGVPAKFAVIGKPRDVAYGSTAQPAAPRRQPCTALQACSPSAPPAARVPPVSCVAWRRCGLGARGIHAPGRLVSWTSCPQPNPLPPPSCRCSVGAAGGGEPRVLCGLQRPAAGDRTDGALPPLSSWGVCPATAIHGGGAAPRLLATASPPPPPRRRRQSLPPPSVSLTPVCQPLAGPPAARLPRRRPPRLGPAITHPR